jgi:arylsulfatase A-like enzyme
MVRNFIIFIEIGVLGTVRQPLVSEPKDRCALVKTIFLIFDSLNRNSLSPYGGDPELTPNFARLAARTMTFDKHYVGSLPCMPARRDMHTGRLNFTHRPWGPLEPFDNSYARQLSASGTYTHIVTDHYHYFEAGGAGYVQSFDSWSFIRGQEYDPVTVKVQPPIEKLKAEYDDRHYHLDKLDDDKTLTTRSVGRLPHRRMQHAVNAAEFKAEEDFPLSQCFTKAFEFLAENQHAQDWLLQLECFDPHEPFLAADRFPNKDKRPNGKVLDWPAYEKVANSPEEIAEIRGSYMALLQMCDDYLGQLLDWMDATNSWDDTCLIVTTDHGYLLGEHDWWGKNKMPTYEEIAHIPLMVWHPAAPTAAGQRCDALTQTIDLMPTLLECGDQLPPQEVRGQSILPYLKGHAQTQERHVMLGMFGGPICVTDGRYTYYHAPDVEQAHTLGMYTVCPSNMSDPFTPEELAQAELSDPFDFTKGAKLMRIPCTRFANESGLDAARNAAGSNVLFDLETDPKQQHAIHNHEVEAKLQNAIAAEFQSHDAPAELYGYYRLTPSQ